MKNYCNKLISLAVFIVFYSINNNTNAQNRHYNAMTLGMGGGGVALIDGYHANFLNPANLMIDNHEGSVYLNQLGFMGTGISLDGSLININVYNEYLTKGLTIEGQVQEDMLDSWFGTNDNDQRAINISNDIVPFGYSKRTTGAAMGGESLPFFKRAGFSIATRIRNNQEFTINRGFANVFFSGLDSDKFSEPHPFDLNTKFLSYAEVSVGYATALPIPFKGIIKKLPFINDIDIFVGIAPKYLIGIQSFEFDFASTLQVNSPFVKGNLIIHDFDYKLYTYGEISDNLDEYAEKKSDGKDPLFADYTGYSGSDIGTLGSGLGLDLGVTLAMDVSLPILNVLDKNQQLRVSLSLTDQGTISYNNNPMVFNGKGTFEFDPEIGDDDPTNFFNDLADSLQNDIYGNFTSESSVENSYELPATVNLGAALIVGKLLVSGDISYGFNEISNNVTEPIFTFGTQYRFFDFIPIRFGTRIGGGTSTAFSTGLGIDLKNLEFSIGGLIVTDSSIGGASLSGALSGLILRF